MRSAIGSLFLAALLTGGNLFAAPPQPPADPAILILPFSSAEDGGNIVLAKGVQQDLAANLAFGKLRIISPNLPSGPADTESALKMAREANATIVVFGHTQTNGKDVRLSGEVVDVATGKPLGGLKVTGASEDLFHLEDILGAQAMWALPPSMRDNQALVKATEIARRMPEPMQPVSATTTATNPPIVTIPAIPQAYPIQQYDPIPVSYPTAPYYDPYVSGYPYGYGLGYSPLFIISGGSRFGRYGYGDHYGYGNNFGFGGFRGRGFIGGYNGGFYGGGFNGGFRGGSHSGFHGGYGNGSGGQGYGGGFHSGGASMVGASYGGGFSGGHR